jgi:RHS repeat-associated protein
MVELMDYYPFGEIKTDWKFGSFDEQRKFSGHEYDSDTGLTYMNARYYNGKFGRFTSQDAVFMAIGDQETSKQLTKQGLRDILADPQNLNAYAYARNNPLSYVDPTGDWSFNLFSPSWQVRIGNAAENAYNNNAVARYALDHPIMGGAAIGVFGGLAVGGGVIAGGGAITCGAVCGPTATTIAGGSSVIGSQSNKATQVYNNASNFVMNRFGFTNLPSRSEVISVYNKWSNTTFSNKTSSILYHYGRHSEGRTLQQLTNNGINVWNNYINNSSSVRSATNTILGNGNSGIKINLTNGSGGIFTKGGQIVTTW